MTPIANQRNITHPTGLSPICERIEARTHPSVYYPDELYSHSPSSIDHRERRIFEESKQASHIVAYYLRKGNQIRVVEEKQFYFNCAAINLKELINRYRIEKNVTLIIDNLFSDDLCSLAFLQTKGVFDSLLEAACWVIGRHNFFSNFNENDQIEYINQLLYEKFTNYAEDKNFGPAKVCFYHYICQTGIQREKIDISMDKLREIFTYFQDKTYVPYGESEIKNFVKGMETLIHIDLVLYNFLSHYQKGQILKPAPFPLIVDWTLSRPFPEKRKRECEFQEIFCSIPCSQLNTLPDPVHRTCETVIKTESSHTSTFKLDLTNTQDLMSKRGFDNQVLTKIVDIQGLERGNQQQVGNQQEDISIDDIQLEDREEQKRGNSSESQDKKIESKSQSEQTGTEYTISNQNTTEDGVEISHSESDRTEDTTTKEKIDERSDSKTNKKNNSAGVNLLFVSVGGGGSSETTNGTKTSEKTGTQHSHAVEKKQENKTSQRSTQQDGFSVTNHSNQERSEQKQNENLVTHKAEVENSTSFERKFGKKNEKKAIQDHSHQANELQRGQLEKGAESHLKSIVDYQSLTSAVISKGSEFNRIKKDEQTFNTSETITIPPGYLLIIKVESVKKTIIYSIKQTIQMDVYSIERMEDRHVSPYLQPLIGRIQNVHNRRFFQKRFEIESIPLGDPTVKHLALAIREGTREIQDKTIQLNNLYYRLDLYLRSFPELNLARYADLQKDFIEFAAIQHYASSKDCLEKMFYGFHHERLWHEEGFIGLLKEFNDNHSHARYYTPIDPLNQGAGTLFYKKESLGLSLRGINAGGLNPEELPPTRGLFIGSKQLTLEDSYKNLLVCGGVGSGKTSAICIPNLLQLQNCSILVTDVAGEIYEKTYQIMQRRGFDIKVLDIQNPSIGDFFNPLSHLNLNSFDEIKQTIDCIMKAKGFDETSGEKDAFWIIGGKSILELSLMILMEKKERTRNKTVTLRDLFAQAIALDSRSVEEIIGSPTTSDRLKELASAVQSGGNSFADRAAYAKSAIAFFSAPNVTQLTSSIDLTRSSSIDFNQLREKPTVIYLKIGVDQLRNYNFLLSLFYTQFFSQCTRNSRITTGENGLPVMCIMDEFGHTPIPDFQTTITTLRKHDVSITAIVQSTSQLKELYGEENAKTILQGGFASKLYFALDTSEVDVAKQISEASGKRLEDRKARSGGHISFNEQESDALPIQNIMYPGTNKATFLHAGLEPIQIELVPYFKNPHLRTLLEDQPPHSPPPSVKKAAVSASAESYLSKEGAMNELIALMQEKYPGTETGAIQRKGLKGTKEDFIKLLERKKIPVEDEPFFSLIEEITANRSDLFSHIKFTKLPQASQGEIRESYDQTISLNAEDPFGDLIEFIEIVKEKGFSLEEIASLETQNKTILEKRPELTNNIQNLVVDIFIFGGTLSREHVSKILQSPYHDDENCIRWVEYLLTNCYRDPKTKTMLKDLIWSRLMHRCDINQDLFDAMLSYYSDETSLSKDSIMIQLQLSKNPDLQTTLTHEGKIWNVETNQEKVKGVKELSIQCNGVKKVIKYRIDTREIKIFVQK